VVVGDAYGLHPGVDDDRADEFEAAFLEGFGDVFGEWGFGGDGAFELNGFVACHSPYEFGEVFAGLLHVEVGAGTADGGFDLGARANDAGVFEEAQDVGFFEAGYLFGIEVFEGLHEGFALVEDDAPGEAGLEAVEHEVLPELAAVVDGDAPLFVVVGLHDGGGIGGPGAAGDGFGHGESPENLYHAIFSENGPAWVL
jgi:hypothetical protein